MLELAQQRFKVTKDRLVRLQEEVDKLQTIADELERNEASEREQLIAVEKKLAIAKLELNEQKQKMERAKITIAR